MCKHEERLLCHFAGTSGLPLDAKYCDFSEIDW